MKKPIYDYWVDDRAINTKDFLMRIDYNIHLDYSDVLLQPKRSALSSKRDVDILRKYKFRNSGKELTYVLRDGTQTWMASALFPWQGCCKNLKC